MTLALKIVSCYPHTLDTQPPHTHTNGGYQRLMPRLRSLYRDISLYDVDDDSVPVTMHASVLSESVCIALGSLGVLYILQ
jgi:hypothetical protein